MRKFLFILSLLFLIVSCCSQEGLVTREAISGTTVENDLERRFDCQATTIQLKGAAYSTPITTDGHTVVIGTHKRSIYFLSHEEDSNQTDDQYQYIGKDSIQTIFRTKFWVHATPSMVYDSLVAIGSYDGNLYFFDKHGELQNKIRPKGRIFTNPEQLNTNWIVFGIGYKGLRYYNKQTDSSFTAKTKKLTHGSPTVLRNGSICIGSNDKNIYFFDENGNKISTYKTNGWIMHSKALPLSDSIVVIGSYDNNLYAVSYSGNLLWKYQTDGKIHASPKQFSNGNIICGSFDKNIYVIDSSGQEIAKIPTKKRVVSSATILGQYAVVGSYDKNLYIISDKGTLAAKIPLGGKIFSSPIILNDNTIFCATTNGKAVFIKNLEIQILRAIKPL